MNTTIGGPMMEEFELRIVKNHPLVCLDGGVALLDTGSPYNIGLGDAFHLLGREWMPSIRSSSGVLELVAEQLGEPVGWLLGYEFLKEYRVLLDYSRGIAKFSDNTIEIENGVDMELKLVMGVPLIEVEYSNRKIQAVLDTGAALSYVSAEAVDGLEALRSQSDFYPMFGEFETNVWRVSVNAAGERLNVEAGVLPDMLQLMLGMISDGWIIGSDFFPGRQIVLDFQGERLIVGPRHAASQGADIQNTAIRVNASRSPLRLSRERPLLSATTISALDYYNEQFDRDLATVIAGVNEQHFRLSVASFCPDYPPRESMYAEPAAGFSRLKDQVWFLASLFVSQLVDQASHCTAGKVFATRAGTRGNIVLVGLLSSYWCVVHPGHLLLVLAMYRLPFTPELLAEGLREILSADLARLPVALPERERILAEIREALSPQSVPDSLRAFVPHGDAYRWKFNSDTVEVLRLAAATAIGTKRI